MSVHSFLKENKCWSCAYFCGARARKGSNITTGDSGICSNRGSGYYNKEVNDYGRGCSRYTRCDLAETMINEQRAKQEQKRQAERERKLMLAEQDRIRNENETLILQRQRAAEELAQARRALEEERKRLEYTVWYSKLTKEEQATEDRRIAEEKRKKEERERKRRIKEVTDQTLEGILNRQVERSSAIVDKKYIKPICLYSAIALVVMIVGIFFSAVGGKLKDGTGYSIGCIFAFAVIDFYLSVRCTEFIFTVRNRLQPIQTFRPYRRQTKEVNIKALVLIVSCIMWCALTVVCVIVGMVKGDTLKRRVIVDGDTSAVCNVWFWLIPAFVLLAAEIVMLVLTEINYRNMSEEKEELQTEAYDTVKKLHLNDEGFIVDEDNKYVDLYGDPMDVNGMSAAEIAAKGVKLETLFK